MLRRAYLTYMAGAYHVYYYNNTAWDVVKPEPEVAGAARFQQLNETLSALPYWRMEPANQLAIRRLLPGRRPEKSTPAIRRARARASGHRASDGARAASAAILAGEVPPMARAGRRAASPMVFRGRGVILNLGR